MQEGQDESDVERLIREDIARRCRLRADAQLPLLDVDAELAMAVALDRRHAYEAEETKHADVLRNIKGDVLAEIRGRIADPSWPQTNGGRHLVHLEARQRFQKFLAEQGVNFVPLPARKPPPR